MNNTTNKSLSWVKICSKKTNNGDWLHLALNYFSIKKLHTAQQQKTPESILFRIANSSQVYGAEFRARFMARCHNFTLSSLTLIKIVLILLPVYFKTGFKLKFKLIS